MKNALEKGCKNNRTDCGYIGWASFGMFETTLVLTRNSTCAFVVAVGTCFICCVAGVVDEYMRNQQQASIENITMAVARNGSDLTSALEPEIMETRNPMSLT